MSGGCGGHHAKFSRFGRNMLCHCNSEQTRQLLVNAWHCVYMYIIQESGLGVQTPEAFQAAW